MVFRIVDSTIQPKGLLGLSSRKKSRVVTCCDIFGADCIGIVEQATELDPVVALHTGVGGSSPLVFIDEVIDDATKLLLHVDCIEGDAQAISDSAGITRVFRTAAALAMGRRSDHRKQSRRWQCAGRFAFAGTHEQPNHLVPLLVKQDGRDVHLVIKPDAGCSVNSGLGSVRGARMAENRRSDKTGTQQQRLE